MSDAQRLAREVERLFAAMTKRRDETLPQLTASQRLALALIVDEGPLRLGVLADRMRTTDPTATRTVDALERDGFVMRAADPLDRRAVLVAPTPAGRRALQRLRRKLVQVLASSLTDLPERDRERLVELLDALNRSLEQDALPRAATGR